MFRRVLFAGAVLSALLIVAVGQSQSAQAQSQNQGAQNYNRFYHYPYVTYPQNYWGDAAYRSADSMYYRYKPEHRIPVYNKKWHNYYPSSRRYHWGHQFITDIF